MSSIAEIEAAIERLQPVEVAAVAAWLSEYQQMIQSTAEDFTTYNREEKTCKEPAGAVAMLGFAQRFRSVTRPTADWMDELRAREHE